MAISASISRLVGSFLRVVLIPLILVGIPVWPILGLLCIVPIIGIITIPLFLLLTILLLYSVAWFSYLTLAQADPPGIKDGIITTFLPFLPYSPLRCLKVNWAAALYAISACRVVLPAILDWSYRRVMVLGTQGGGIVKENILYGSPHPGKRLDIYLPPSKQPAPDLPYAGTSNDADGDSTRKLAKAPVVVFIPSPIPPLTWTGKRKTYLQLALRLRRMGYCVVVPDITFYPEARINASIVDLRLVLRWVADNCERYGGDAKRINLLGHGMSAHLAMLTLTQEAVVLSREGFLQQEYQRESDREKMTRWDDSNDESTMRADEDSIKKAEDRQHRTTTARTHSSTAEENAWVDEPNEYELPPGAVIAGSEDIPTSFAQTMQSAEDGKRSGVPFPASSANRWQQRGGSDDTVAATTRTDSNTAASISNGLRRVEIYEPQIEIPPIAGVILLAGVFDVIKCFRGESDRGVEHLSALRRSCGPSHTSCLLHSPAHLLYAAKNIIDVSLLPPKFLLIHGGKDTVVDISQSTLLKTLLSGIGVDNVNLRAYRELGHAEAVASLFLGMGKSSTRYSKQILHDVSDFISS
ncbi:hypothetical protein CBS101457_003647 [Exobasidium rhododendri]|nr:hypothetical protein CBS101457_003647 [Exobasidium rhododendri]